MPIPLIVSIRIEDALVVIDHWQPSRSANARAFASTLYTQLDLVAHAQVRVTVAGGDASAPNQGDSQLLAVEPSMLLCSNASVHLGGSTATLREVSLVGVPTLQALSSRLRPPADSRPEPKTAVTA